MNITGAADHYKTDVMNPQFSNQEDKRLTDIFSQMIQDKKEEFYVKVKTGTFEPSFAIGAGCFTEKEWDKLVESFDIMQDAMSEAANKEESEEKSDSVVNEEEEDAPPKNMQMLMADYTLRTHSSEDSDEEKEEGNEQTENVDMLMADYMTCINPSEDPDKEDEVYMIVYDLEGMRCLNKKTGELEWAITFNDDTQYAKLQERLSRTASGESTAFACQESYWQDFYRAG